MVFNSADFVAFFIIVFFVYYFILKENTKWQNVFLLISSYFFYAWANWKILPILIVSTLVFYGLGFAIHKAISQNKKRLFTTLGVISGVGMLVYFKYTNFFITSFKELFDSMGLHTNLHTINIIMPVGISFYTFRLLSYLFEINRTKLKPTRDFVAFSTYVAFFPSILSGPIDRPGTLIPQLQKKRVFDYNLAVDGCRQILWGAFKKIVIADNLSIYVNLINGSETPSGSSLLLAAVFFTLMLYADFSGYTDMAIGIGKLLGFQLTKNFNFPLFAQNIADFWRRWHISLTSWLTDYVFMPLNFKWRYLKNWGTIFAIIITFLLIGLWHGDKWNFVAFGLYNGILYIPLIFSGAMFKKTKIEINKFGLPKFKNFGKMVLTFLLVTFGLILFSSENISNAGQYIREMLSGLFQKSSYVQTVNLFYWEIGYTLPLLLFLFLLIEWSGKNGEYALAKWGLKWKRPLRYAMYIAMIIAIFWFNGNEKQFVYFQF